MHEHNPKLPLLFRLSLLIKGFDGIIEMILGCVMLIVNKAVLITDFLNFFNNQLSDNPHDIVGNLIVNTAAAFSVGSAYLLGIYFLAHGFIKFSLVIALFKNKHWAYPVSILVFGGFVIYEFFQYLQNHSAWILAFAIIDLIIVFYSVFEWRRYIHRRRMHHHGHQV
jgi:uncharacterized membrane protein